MRFMMRSAAIAAAVLTTGATLAGGMGSASTDHPASVDLAASQAANQAANQAAPTSVKVALTPSSAQLATCMPKAKVNVDVALRTDATGRDVFYIEGSGLPPRTDFTVFLLQQADSPFGAAEYIGDLSSDAHGRGENTFKLIV